MSMRDVHKITSIAIVLTFASIALSCSNKYSDDSISGALSAFIRHKISQDYEKLWSSSSRRFRNANDNDMRAYETYARSYGVHPGKVDVLRISESGPEAKIKIKVLYIENNGSSAGSAIEEWRFVNDNREWYFDGSRALSESAN